MTTELFGRAGSLGPAYAGVDWEATPLGPADSWRGVLRIGVDFVLGTRFPVALLWGPELVLLYNDAYADLIGDKHPAALGSPAEKVFPESWPVVGPVLRNVLDRGEGAWMRDVLVPLDRSGFVEECYFTLSYSPVHGRDGSVEGVVAIVAETTAQVVTGRRLGLLTRLGARLGELDDLEELRTAAVATLATANPDLPEVELVLPALGDVPPPGAPELDAATDLVLDADGRSAWVRIPVTDPDAGGSLLRATLSRRLPHDDDYLAFLRLVAAALGRTMDRVLAIRSERRLSAALQLSLLAKPVDAPDLDVAVRYLPATEVAQIGGDWYDAFRLPDGSLAVVVGDVAGHDQRAAAGMAQVRNLTRGVAYSLADAPSTTLAGVDRAMRGLDVGVIATAVFAQIGDGQDGSRVLRWSNAGHPPPVLIAPDGSARLLETAPELLLGLDPDTHRADHVVDLEPGGTLLLYTDGFVERRGESLQQGLDWLIHAVRGLQHLHPEELCNRLLGEVAGDLEDDVALLALRIRPANRPTGG